MVELILGILIGGWLVARAIKKSQRKAATETESGAADNGCGIIAVVVMAAVFFLLLSRVFG